MEERDRILREVKDAVRDAREASLECRVCQGSEEAIIWVRVHLYPVFDDLSTPLRLVILVEDVSQEMAQQQVLHYQACHDPLTGLPNRRNNFV